MLFAIKLHLYTLCFLRDYLLKAVAGLQLFGKYDINRFSLHKRGVLFFKLLCENAQKTKLS